MKINIYTDGAQSSLTKKGGWAVYCPELRLRMCNSVENTTNNRMELLSAIKALEFLKAVESKYNFEEVNIFSDSLYLVATMQGRYMKKTNIDLWEQLEELSLQFNFPIKFIHVKGHAGNSNNEVVDKLANLVSQKL